MMAPRIRWTQWSARCVDTWAGPRDASDLHVLVSDSDGVVVLIEKDAITVFENDRPIVMVRNRDSTAGLDYLSYEVQMDDTWLSVIDDDFDGQADSKYTAGSNRQHWMWFKDMWREADLFNAPEPNRILLEGIWWNYKVIDGEISLIDEYVGGGSS